MIEIVRSPLGHSSTDSTTIKLVQPKSNIIEIKQTGKQGTGQFGQNFLESEEDRCRQFYPRKTKKLFPALELVISRSQDNRSRAQMISI